MIDFFQSGGYIMWPLTVAAVLAGASAVRALLALRAGAAEPERARGLVDGVLFWGGIAGALGILGTVVGIANVARAIGLAGSVSAPLAWSGIGVSLTTTLAGLVIFLAALLAWYGLRTRARRYVSA